MVTKRTFVKGAASFAALFSSELKALAQSARGTPRLLLGPMQGPPTENACIVWAMTIDASPVSIEYADNPDFRGAKRTPPTKPSREGGVFIYRGEVRGLKSATDYWYRVVINGEPDKYRAADPFGRLRTAPGRGARASFSVGFGSCARIQADPVQPIWNAVLRRDPDLFLWLGDNIYADALESFVLDLEYQRQRGIASFAPVARDIPQLAIWDDHDFGLNYHDRTNPIKEAALDAFRRYWVNPAYGTAQAPGVFFQYAYGAVDFFFLDGRYYRDPNTEEDAPGKTLLGATQKAWLKDALKRSDAVFKVLACGSGWSAAKGPGGDSWASFMHERNEIFDFIQREKIGGVLLISGDTHVAELNCIPWSERGGYDFYDLVSSPLGQRPSQSWLQRNPEQRIRIPYNMSANFGRLSFSFDGPPTATFNVIDPANRAVWRPFRIEAAQLRNGVASWRALTHL